MDLLTEGSEAWNPYKSSEGCAVATASNAREALDRPPNCQPLVGRVM